MNFALIVFGLCVVTGVLWFADRFLWQPKRDPQAARPIWLEYTAGFFPVIFVVFVLRNSFTDHSHQNRFNGIAATGGCRGLSLSPG
jgi:hypothetical protein